MCGQFAVLHNDAYDVLSYVKPNKNDAADAEAICEAARRHHAICAGEVGRAAQPG
jgi:hypothetical protein